MNLITQSDVKKFIRLLKAGLKKGEGKDMRTYTSASQLEGTNVAMEYFVHLEFSFRIPRDIAETIIADDTFDEDIKELLKSMN